MNNTLQYQFVKPVRLLEDFVYGFSSLHNLSGLKDGIIIPNGRIDLLFCLTADDQYHVTLMGLEKQNPMAFGNEKNLLIGQKANGIIGFYASFKTRCVKEQRPRPKNQLRMANECMRRMR